MKRGFPPPFSILVNVHEHIQKNFIIFGGKRAGFFGKGMVSLG